MDRRGRPMNYRLGTKNGTIVHLIMLCGAVPTDVFSKIYANKRSQTFAWERRIRALAKKKIITYMVFDDTTIKGITFAAPDIPEEVEKQADPGYVKYYKAFGRLSRSRAISFPSKAEQKTISNEYYNVTHRKVKRKSKKKRSGTISEGLRVAKNAYAIAMFQQTYINVYPRSRLPLPIMPGDIPRIYASGVSYTEVLSELSVVLPTYYTGYALRTFRMDETIVSAFEARRAARSQAKEDSEKRANLRPNYPAGAELHQLLQDAWKAASTKKTSSVAGIYAGGGLTEEEFYYSVYVLPKGNMKWSTTEESNFWSEVSMMMEHYGRHPILSHKITAVELYGEPDTVIKQVVGYRGKRYLNADGYGVLEKNYAIPLSHDGLLLLQEMLTPGWESKIHTAVLTKDLYKEGSEGDTVYDGIDLIGKTYYFDFCVPDIIRLRKFLRSIPLVTNADFSFEIDCFDFQVPIIWNVIRGMRSNGELNVQMTNVFRDEEHFPGLEIKDSNPDDANLVKHVAIAEYQMKEVLYGEDPDEHKPNILLAMINKDNTRKGSTEKRMRTMARKKAEKEAQKDPSSDEDDEEE